MRFKRTSALVVLISSAVIASVLGLTIFGFYAYLECKEKSSRKNYRLALYGLNGRIFDKYVPVNLQAKIDREGAFKDSPTVYGTITNNSNKKIYSLKLKITFSDPERRVVYVDTFYPVGSDIESSAGITDIVKKTENFLSEGDSISFTRQLNNCPQELLDYLKSRLKFAKLKSVEAMKLSYKIEGLDIR